MSMLGALRRLLGRDRAMGGHIPGPSAGSDSVLVRLSPGYVSLDRGETWHEADGPNP